MTIERRLLPRYTIEWSVMLVDPQGRQFAAQAHNISRGGAGLQARRAAVEGLAQSGALLMPGDRVRLVFLGAPGAISRNKAGFDCRVREVRRLALDSYLINLWFAALGPQDEEAAEALVDLAQV